MSKKCDMVITLTIPCVPTSVSDMKYNLPKYLTQDCFDKDLVIVENIKAIEVYEG